ncbi:hypothetical protein ACFZCL_32455 [Streptomyces sp. NPDC008159]|uniref:hypothetical protein n=1 Tax=Streptomyces sp. NPDC008159 TaxID=3364817 RepID=UPI0036E7B2A2
MAHPMPHHTTHSAYVEVYSTLRQAAAALEELKRTGAGEGFAEPYAGAAMHAVRFAVAVLHPVLPCQPGPPADHEPQRQLDLAAHWRDAAFEIGEFAPEPMLRVVRGEEGGPARGGGVQGA